jgi:hypothetical protein
MNVEYAISNCKHNLPMRIPILKYSQVWTLQIFYGGVSAGHVLTNPLVNGMIVNATSGFHSRALFITLGTYISKFVPCQIGMGATKKKLRALIDRVVNVCPTFCRNTRRGIWPLFHACRLARCQCHPSTSKTAPFTRLAIVSLLCLCFPSVTSLTVKLVSGDCCSCFVLPDNAS